MLNVLIVGKTANNTGIKWSIFLIYLNIFAEYAAFAIFDGHGGKNAAHFARDHLLENIKTQKGFFSNDTEVVKKAISDAFVATHYAMWNELRKFTKVIHLWFYGCKTIEFVSFYKTLYLM